MKPTVKPVGGLGLVRKEENEFFKSAYIDLQCLFVPLIVNLLVSRASIKILELENYRRS